MSLGAPVLPLDRLGPSHVPDWSGIAATSERPASLLVCLKPARTQNPVQSVYGAGDGDGDSDGVGVGASDGDDDDGDGAGDDHNGDGDGCDYYHYYFYYD